MRKGVSDMLSESIIVSEAMAERSIESLLKQQLGMSGSYISRLKRRPIGITLNGAKAYTTAKVKEGDVLTAQTGDPEDYPRARPMTAELNIPWQDSYIAIIDKAAGMAVHQSTRDPDELTMENAFAAQFPVGENFHPVSRLDRGTTGLMTVAKCGYMHHRLKQMLHTELFRREYIGIAVGHVFPHKGHIELPIGMAEGSTYQRAVRPGGIYAHTEYHVLGFYGGYTLLRLIPHTGRTHQLRLHMAAIGYPLAGDWLYGECINDIQRPALHSAELWLEHPMSGECVHLVSPVPEDMQMLIG